MICCVYPQVQVDNYPFEPPGGVVKKWSLKKENREKKLRMEKWVSRNKNKTDLGKEITSAPNRFLV